MTVVRACGVLVLPAAAHPPRPLVVGV